MSKLAAVVKTYVVKRPNEPIVKIGKTINIDRRIRTLSTMNGCNLDVIAVLDCDIESLMHTKFAHLRTVGEWFDFSTNEIASFLSDEKEILALSSINPIKVEKQIDCNKLMIAIDKMMFKEKELPVSRLLNGSIGGNLAKELDDRLPSHLFFEESSHNLLGCEAIAFIFEDAVYSVAPNFGAKFNSLEEYIQYHKKEQEAFSIDENIDIEDLPSWDDYAVFMRNHAQAMIAEITRDNA